MKVTIEELRKIIPTIGTIITPIIQSEPGCGKTSLLKMLEKDLGDKYDYIYVDCPVKDMSDIAMTIPNHDTKALENYVGSLFKLDNGKPKVLLLDECFAALDVLTIKMLQEIIVNLQQENQITICICDHQARDLLACVDVAMILSNGKIIAQDTPSSLVKDTNAKNAYFGNSFKFN